MPLEWTTPLHEVVGAYSPGTLAGQVAKDLPRMLCRVHAPDGRIWRARTVGEFAWSIGEASARAPAWRASAALALPFASQVVMCAPLERLQSMLPSGTLAVDGGGALSLDVRVSAGGVGMPGWTIEARKTMRICRVCASPPSGAEPRVEMRARWSSGDARGRCTLVSQVSPVARDMR